MCVTLSIWRLTGTCSGESLHGVLSIRKLLAGVLEHWSKLVYIADGDGDKYGGGPSWISSVSGYDVHLVFGGALRRE